MPPDFTKCFYFNPRPPRGGRLAIAAPVAAPSAISIHALREEGDDGHPGSGEPDHYFNPRPPRGGRRSFSARGIYPFRISIHALREEGDSAWTAAPPSRQNFNPRPPRGGRRREKRRIKRMMEFQSTPSARRATALGRREEAPVGISIHALREEGDPRLFSPLWDSFLFQSTPSARRATSIAVDPQVQALIFQSTPSARRATQLLYYDQSGRPISIHALREEGDLCRVHVLQLDIHFNPRPPRGGRRQRRYQRAEHREFQSTPSARRATGLAILIDRVVNISIHALREEGDAMDPAQSESLPYFNPRPPRGGRPFTFCSQNRTAEFQSTPSARRATTKRLL